MKVEIISANEAIKSGLSASKLVSYGHGAFGEPDNEYENIVYIGSEKHRLFETDFIVLIGESPNREVIQVISEWNSSDKLLELVNPKLLQKRKDEKYKKFLKLKEEVESSEYFSAKK